MKSLLIEGWRSSPHSYALVDQHQALCLASDERFALYHTDVPFFRPEWQQLDAGFSPVAKAVLSGLRAPPQLPVDVIYRVSWPLRVHAGPAERIFLFATCEFGQHPPGSIVGPDGNERGVDFKSVEVVTSSRWSKEGLVAMGFEAGRIHTISLGVDPSMFEVPEVELRQQIRRDLKIRDDACVFLNVSAMTWNKGIAPLVAAFARHRLKNQNAVLVLKGGDALYGSQVAFSVAAAAKLNPEVADAQVVASIRYVPHNLTQTALAGLYLASDVYVSTYRAEGFNLPVLEALATGRPVIVTGGGSTDDFCPAGYSLKIDAMRCTGAVGYYLEPSVDSIVAHMQRVTDAAAEFRASAMAGRQEIRSRYSWQSVTRQLGDIFDA